MSKGYLGLDISDSAIRYTYLEQEGRELWILKAGKSDFSLDLSAADGLTNEIKLICHNEEIDPKRIFLTLTRKDILIHQLTLPSLNARELEEVVSSEIEKIPAFSHGLYNYVFASYPAPRDKSRVIFSAIDRLTLEYILHEVKKCDITFKDCEIAPLNFKEVLSLTDTFNKCQAFLTVHEQFIYLTICYKKQYKLFYKISTGSEQFVHLSSEGEKEEAVKDWSNELGRVIKSFELENKNLNIDKVSLICDVEKAPNLHQYLSDGLRRPVETISVANIGGLKTVENYPLNPIYFYALTPVLCHIYKLKPDFPLRHFFQQFQLRDYAIKVGAITLAIVFGVGILFGLVNMRVNSARKNYQEKTKITKDKSDNLEKEFDLLFQEHAEYLTVRQQFLDQATFVQSLNRISWAQVFSVVAKELPDNLALTSFKFNESGQARIKGNAFEMESIAAMIRRIDDSEILHKGKFDFLKEKEVKKQKLFDFGIYARLKNDES